MSTEIRGRFGPMEGTYKKESVLPIILKPCEHAVIKEERIIRHNKIIIVHGKNNGESSITEQDIGADLK